MAVEVRPLNELLTVITDAFVAAQSVLPEDAQIFEPPQDGMSLLDVKNDLLLSYLQHLVFLIIFRLKNSSSSGSGSVGLDKDIIKKLVELRAYFDRGVRPLEGRLRYQIDKVLRAAEDAERSEAQRSQANEIGVKNKSKKLRQATDAGSDVSVSGSDSGDDSGIDESDGRDTEDEEATAAPNRALLAQSARQQAAATSAKQRQNGGRNGVYRPPRLNPVAMPENTSRARADAEEGRLGRRRKNALLDEYINEEHSSAPTAQPSIGSNNTILARGRHHSALNNRDRDRERERTEYEERNFTRLPGMGKAEKKKDKARQMREGRDMFGGEDWTGLGGLGDRIGKTVDGKGRGRESVLDRREKRKRDTQDLPRGDGVGIGESFEKRRKVLQRRTDRKKSRR
ncbi:hypothetical protein LTR05_005555 [Lithohypha guttulata]|uniref:Uncharacterized protein n=1 Tax=Lithohypha guttulata TaxID=1690604 RepID=A0AAN7YA40_9EURO|nr:hypothetical protein LTR05_005555 [Lithohypha guttulata]